MRLKPVQNQKLKNIFRGAAIAATLMVAGINVAGSEEPKQETVAQTQTRRELEARYWKDAGLAEITSADVARCERQNNKIKCLQGINDLRNICYTIAVGLCFLVIGVLSISAFYGDKILDFLKRKKEWIKLNASYVVATSTNFGVAMASAHLAQKAGVSKESATSWVAFTSGFTAGFVALVATWYFLHVGKYQKDMGKIAKDAWSMFKNIWKAQFVSLAIIMPGSWIAASFGMATTLIVAAQQIIDRLIFIPAFNFFSRHQIREMEKEDGE